MGKMVFDTGMRVCGAQINAQCRCSASAELTECALVVAPRPVNENRRGESKDAAVGLSVLIGVSGLSDDSREVGFVHWRLVLPD